MGIAADITGDWHAALAALAWQVDAGVAEVIGDTPVNRYELATEAQKVAPARAEATLPIVSADPVAVAKALAGQAGTLEDLRAALAAFDHCELKRGARNTVFADGNPAARVLVLGEAPGAEEDREGRPFVGKAGQLLDRMFAAIGLSRTSPDAKTALYITNVMPWRPPGNRDPEPGEIAMMQPFLERHIALADPEVIVVMGNTPLFALTGGKGILRARGTWAQALGRPLLPMTHPAYLLRNPAAKREAWADLLSVQARLRG
jgi:uracil-DNA glycosylase family 4